MEHSGDLDLRAGLPISELAEGGIVVGRVDGEEAILMRRGKDYFAVGASCTHYHGPLAKGLVVGDTIRCPLHHACFSLRTGEALYAPALDPIGCWRVEVVLDKIFVREKLNLPKRTLGSTNAAPSKIPTSIVIVGGGAAALAAADMLRRSGYRGPVTMVSADDVPP
jgi:apoptosis-inducing factor 3